MRQNALLAAFVRTCALFYPFRTNCSPVLGTNYVEFEWFVPRTRLQF